MKRKRRIRTIKIVKKCMLALLACLVVSLLRRGIPFPDTFSFRRRVHRSFAHASYAAIYAYVYLCTKQSARTCRARNISRVPIELCHPKTSLSFYSRFSFPIQMEARVSQQIDLPRRLEMVVACASKHVRPFRRSCYFYAHSCSFSPSFFW